jgi:hypothetical protein
MMNITDLLNNFWFVGVLYAAKKDLICVFFVHGTLFGLVRNDDEVSLLFF